ncbi:MAG: winged helix-turn-helix transcriptional regulator [Thermoplasmata archaeon]
MRTSAAPTPVQFKVDFETCPVQASLGILGRKWSHLVLRDIALFRAPRFNEMMRKTPGITKRTLAMRLRELEREGFIARAEVRRNYTKWAVTEKGLDVLPVLMTLVRFGSKWHAAEVFADGRSRVLTEIFDEAYIRRILAAPPGSPRHRASRTPAPGFVSATASVSAST